MTITVQEARKILPAEYSQTTDEEIQNMINYMYFICNFAIDWQEKHPGEDIRDHFKSKTQEK